jgi:hypothetical protein
MNQPRSGMLAAVQPGFPVHKWELTTAEEKSVTVQRQPWKRFNRTTRKWEPDGYWCFICQCEKCGVLFRSRRGKTRFCSDVCNRADRKQRREPTVRQPVVCECGKGIVVPAATGRTPRHCSPACRQRAYRQRRQASASGVDLQPAEASP